MFAGIKAPSNFMMPRWSAADVGEFIHRIAWSEKAQNLMVPAIANVSTTTRCLTSWLRVGMQDGGAEVMTEQTTLQSMNQEL